jgi:hypothetical protein
MIALIDLYATLAILSSAVPLPQFWGGMLATNLAAPSLSFYSRAFALAYFLLPTPLGKGGDH